jgi:hypothetical protein
MDEFISDYQKEFLAATTFEIHGYLEEFYDTRTIKFLGIKKHTNIPQGRIMGGSNSVEMCLISDLDLEHFTGKKVRIKANKNLTMISTITAICGRLKTNFTTTHRKLLNA